MEIQSLLPSFEDKKLHSVDKTASKIFEELNNKLNAIKTLANPLKCEEKYLPFLAYAFKVDFWDENLTVNEKRDLIKQSLLLHRYKGTVWAIEKIFEILNIKAVVKEWFDYKGDPYHFKIDLSLEDKEINSKTVIRLQKYIKIYKNVRSVLDELALSYRQQQNVSIGVGGVGEVFCSSEMLKGYKQTSRSITNISIGAVGETSSYANFKGF